MKIKRFDPRQMESVVKLSLRAWEPVFLSLREAMDSEVFDAQHPNWRGSQKDAIKAVCTDSAYSVWVAVEKEQVAGFVALKYYEPERLGEIHMIAVDPDFQRRGIGTALTTHSLSCFKKAGMTTAMAETGGDPGHLPARATYEATGFRVLPIARYFKKL